MSCKLEEFFIKDFQNDISLSKNEFLLLVIKFILFLKKKKIYNCDVYVIDVKKNIVFSLYFFALLFYGKKIILNSEIKRIKLNFKKICFLKENSVLVNSKKLSYDALSKEKNIDIIYKDLNPKSMILSFLLVLPAAQKLFFKT